MKIFLDDKRQPNEVYSTDNWTVVTNYNDFVKLVQDAVIINLPITVISLDHDLADEHYEDLFNAVKEQQDLNYENYKEKTGLDCLRFLLYESDLEIEKTTLYFHTMNPVGRDNMIKEIEFYTKNKIFNKDLEN